MRNPVLALYAEGSSDHLFLPIVIQRTSKQLLDQYKQMAIRVLPVKSIILNRLGLSQADYIVQAACQAVDCHALIVHADADDRTSESAMRERYQPGYQQVQQMREHGEQICKHLLPLIPIQMTEAWMLADQETLLQRVIGTSMNAQSLGLPTRMRQIEADANPKSTFNQAVQRAYQHRSRRHRNIDVTPYYESLAQQIKLERLLLLSSYQQFVQDLTDSLKVLNFIH
jgi:hypothetical protein